jgi:hypothetical protein
MRLHLLLALAVLALAARLPGLGWGLPGPTHLFSYHPDEYHSLRGVLSLALSGDLNPHFFNYGCLYLYLVDAAASLVHGDLVSNLTPSRLPEALAAWTLDARVVSLLAGVATVVVVALAAEALTAGAGLWAGLAVALMPLHALHSRYATVDATLCLFTALALLWGILACLRGRPFLYVAAGAAAGLAASTKYSGALVLIVPVLALILDRSLPAGRRVALIVGAIAAALLAFAATSPYVLLAWHEARQGLAFELGHMRTGEFPASAADPSGFLFHLKWLALGTMALAPVGLIACVVYATRRRTTTPSWLPVAAFSVLAFAMICATGVRYARYELILLPAAALGFGAMIASTQHRHLRILAALWLLLAAAHCSQIAVRLTAPDSRDVALAAILDKTGPSDRLGMIWEPWFQCPPVDYCNGGAGLRHTSLWAPFEGPRRPLVILGYDTARLRAERPPWFVLSAVEERDYRRLGAYPELWQVLDGDYRRAGEWGTRRRDGLVPRRLNPPQDWLYPAMPIYLLRRAN